MRVTPRRLACLRPSPILGKCNRGKKRNFRLHGRDHARLQPTEAEDHVTPPRLQQLKRTVPAEQRRQLVGTRTGRGVDAPNFLEFAKVEELLSLPGVSGDSLGGACEPVCFTRMPYLRRTGWRSGCKDRSRMKVHAYAAMSARGRLEPFEYEPEALQGDEVEIKVSHCGICRSDIAMIDNDWGWSNYPLVPGHEVVGTITATGDEVGDRVKIGQRVGIGWQCAACGRCEWCSRDKQNLCAAQTRTIVGHYGGWADRLRCHWKFAVPLPEALPSEDAGPLMCAGSTVFTAMLQFGVAPWMKTAVLGVGGLGHLAVQFLAKMGCEVTAISSSHDKDAEARRLGATRFLATRGTDELQKAAGSFDFVLATVSSDVPWGSCVEALRPQGRLVICGLPESDIRFPVVPLLAERSVSGGSVGSPTDTLRMLEFAARHWVRPMTEHFPLKDVNRALDRVRSGKVRFRAVLDVCEVRVV